MPESAEPWAGTLRIKWRVAVIAAAALAPIAAWALSAFPDLVEWAYTDRVGFAVGFGLSRITTLVPFSLVEILFGLVVIRFLVFAGLSFWAVIRRRRRLRDVVGRGALRFLTTAAIIVLLFYTNWGFNFARAPLATRVGWSEPDEDAPAESRATELAALSEQLLDAANREYLAAQGREDTELPTAFSGDKAALDPLLDAAYSRVGSLLSFPQSFCYVRGRAKPVLLSPVLSQFLVLGFYSPWTGEANYSWATPGCMIPHSIAHEKAHQRGIATEDEANFLGFLACIHSDDAYVRYSGYLFAQRQVVIELADIDLERAKMLLKKRLPGVQRDAGAIRAFITSHAGKLSDAGRKVNSAYLKANRVKAGVKSYSRSVRLLVAFSRAHGGSCVVPAPEK